MKLADKTKYPELFRGTYWGSHRETPLVGDEIISNRNAFVEEFGVMKYYTTSLSSLLKFVDFIHSRYLDHSEVYKTADGSILSLFSPYDSALSGYEWDILEYAGYRKYKRLYANEATTYLVIFESAKAIRAWLKEEAEYMRVCHVLFPLKAKVVKSLSLENPALSVIVRKANLIEYFSDEIRVCGLNRGGFDFRKLKEHSTLIDAAIRKFTDKQINWEA